MYMFNMNWCYNRPSELADDMGNCITISYQTCIFKCYTNGQSNKDMIGVAMNCRVGVGLKGRCPNLNIFLW